MNIKENKMNKIKFYSLGIILLLCQNFSSTLFAADEADQGIEEVIVTARRTEESLQEVPVAVTAFSAEGIEARQIINTSDIQLNVPNVSFTNTNFSGNSFSIRGIGRLVTAGTGEAGVSAHVNDIPIVSNLVTTEYYDMERIEVLRGPQGTLYGRNATGGVVNFITKKPEIGSVGGYLEAEVGDYSHQRVRYAINLPLGERLAIRAAGSTLEREGYTENLFELYDVDIY